MSVEPVSELRHGGAEVDYTPALPHQFDYRYNEHVTLRGLVAHPLCV